jgi:hypothetical protein
MTQPTDPREAEDIPLLPADILTHLVATLLAPMFSLTTGGDIAFAQLGALETLNASRARNPVDLIAISQIVGCGLTALGSLGRSLADDLSLSMTLRLRGNAVALSRSVEHARRAIEKTRPDLEPVPDAEPDPQYEVTVLSSVADTRKRVEEANAAMQAPEPAPVPIPSPPPGNPALPVTEQRRQTSWAPAMSTVASELAGSLPHLSPGERKLTSLRAAALSSCANQLLSGDISSPPRPGDLAALMRPRPG